MGRSAGQTSLVMSLAALVVLAGPACAAGATEAPERTGADKAREGPGANRAPEGIGPAEAREGPGASEAPEEIGADAAREGPAAEGEAEAEAAGDGRSADALPFPVPGTDPELATLVLAGNGLRVTLILPEAEALVTDRWPEDFHGVRFDWSGRVGFVEHAGHTFVGGWAERDGRRVPAYGLGPSEEFRRPKHSRAPQPPFRIGVGVFHRDERDPRRRIEPFPWRVTPEAGAVRFEQSGGPADGYAYRYVKRVALAADAPALVIEHALENRGDRPLVLHHYAHNWFSIDAQAAGRGYRVWLGFAPKVARDHAAFEVSGRRIGFRPAALGPEAAAYVSLVPPGDGAAGKAREETPAGEEEVGRRGMPPETGRVLLEHTGARAAVEIEALDWTPCKVDLYAAGAEVCPEPYLALDLGPGENRSWSTRYTFAALEPAAIAAARRASLRLACAVAAACAAGPGGGAACAGAAMSEGLADLPPPGEADAPPAKAAGREPDAPRGKAVKAP